ncbi:hypothetical protein GQ457_06G031730 [Hibiscus cannabinus]
MKELTQMTVLLREFHRHELCVYMLAPFLSHHGALAYPKKERKKKSMKCLLDVLAYKHTICSFASWKACPILCCLTHKRRLLSPWCDYSLAEVSSVLAKNGTIIHQEQILVIAEYYATPYKVNENCTGHAVLVLPALDSQTAHKFWLSAPKYRIFSNTSRTPQYLLQNLELGYRLMYNDVFHICFCWKLRGSGNDFRCRKPEMLCCHCCISHDIASCYFSLIDQMKPLNHSHDLLPPGNKGRTYACSCMIFLRLADCAKLVDLHLLPQGPDNVPSGRIILQEPNMGTGTANQGNAVKKEIERFRDHGLWLVGADYEKSEKENFLRLPGVEPGSIAWKAIILTVGLQTLSI